ncbi:MAG: tetratricopeptide repeat protein [Deltaproteobacteria bacterium]|jgi:tetratricopeptide (TPR) repeat protein|nr:tetratricopeptide repeat protein [Deltaproteobacteria bacterium]
MSSKVKWAVLLLLLVAVIAGVTYGVFFTPYTALRNMLPVPNKLISVVFIVNGVSHSVPAEGTLVVHPDDVVSVDDIHTDGKFNWGLRLTSEQFSANDLLEGRRDIKEFWPDFESEDPLKVVVDVMAGSQSIGRFNMVVRLRARDWVKKAQEAESPEAKVRYYERAARLASHNALILTNLAQLYAEQDQWARAAATYEKVAATSNTIPILQKLVEAYQKAGKTNQALATYIKLIQKSGTDKEPFYGFISYLNAKKNPTQAASFLSTNLKSFPQTYRPEIHTYLGTLYGQQGEWTKAINSYKRALAGGVANPLIHLNLGEAYSRIGNYRQAEKSLLTYLNMKPKDVDARLRLAAVYRKRNKNKDAISTLKELIKDNPRSLKAHLALVDIYEKLNRDKEAAAVYEAIAKLSPDNKVVHYNQGVLYYEMKQFDRAAKAFSQVLKLDKKDVDAREYLVEVYRKKKKPRQALIVLKELITLRPDHWPYYAEAFELYDQLKAYEEMTKTFASAVGKAPEQPELRYFLGISYEKRNLLVEAIHQFEALVKMAPKNIDYLVHLAGLYEQIGKTENALKTYQKVLDLDPENPEAQENYLRLKMQEIGG